MKYLVSIFVIAFLYSCQSDSINGSWILKTVDNTSWHNEKKMLMEMFETEYNQKDKEQKRLETENEINLIYDSLKKEFIGNVYEFKKDKIATITINGKKDSVKWYLEDKQLVLDEPAMSGIGEPLRYNYTLRKDSLILDLILENDTMTMWLKRL